MSVSMSHPLLFPTLPYSSLPHPTASPPCPLADRFLGSRSRSRSIKSKAQNRQRPFVNAGLLRFPTAGVRSPRPEGLFLQEDTPIIVRELLGGSSRRSHLSASVAPILRSMASSRRKVAGAQRK